MVWIWPNVVWKPILSLPISSYISAMDGQRAPCAPVFIDNKE